MGKWAVWSCVTVWASVDLCECDSVGLWVDTGPVNKAKAHYHDFTRLLNSVLFRLCKPIWQDVPHT